MSVFYIDGSFLGKCKIFGQSLTTTVCTNYNPAQQIELATLINLLLHVSAIVISCDSFNVALFSEVVTIFINAHNPMVQFF